MNPSGSNACTYCRYQPCLWVQFEGAKLTKQLMQNQFNRITEDLQRNNALIINCLDKHNDQVAITQSRVLELWKEYWGHRFFNFRMATWNDFFVHSSDINNNTPICIPCNLYNQVPYHTVDHVTNDVLVKRFSAVEDDTNCYRLVDHVIKQSEVIDENMISR